ncbi:hypothetical protein PtA15_13A301 [Puccinia triticina]|uniref:Uncharacterized protein n=1 Tax=Puccinia triticina TaxID=208348 RepID=A0ABY7D0E6_9BASI|nr:uncharacterized protein PtA15_13A301 [Puccinia triticina]WAQ90901.1 hypothetical protein PtA15_13A301 [Puccinia triticina]
MSDRLPNQESANRSSAPPAIGVNAVASVPEPQGINRSATNNGVAALFDSLFVPTGNTARPLANRTVTQASQALSATAPAALPVSPVLPQPECDSAKLMQVIQELDAKVHRLEATIKLKPVLSDSGKLTADIANRLQKLEQAMESKSRPVDNGNKVAAAIEATMAKVTSRLDQLLAIDFAGFAKLTDVKEQVASTVV